MASGGRSSSSPSSPSSSAACLVLVVALTAASAYRLSPSTSSTTGYNPTFDSVRVTTPARDIPPDQQEQQEQQEKQEHHKHIEFTVRGRHLHAGLAVRVTRIPAVRDSACFGGGAAAPAGFAVDELSVAADGASAVYALTVDLREVRRTRSNSSGGGGVGGGSVYFCLPRVSSSSSRRLWTFTPDGEDGENEIIQAVGDEEEEEAADGGGERGVRWMHQGDNIAIDSAFWLGRGSDDLDTDLDYDDKTIKRGRRQDEEENNVAVLKSHRVTGLRVDIAPKEPHCDEEGIPYLLVGAEYTLRFFGVGFTENTQVTFTQQTGDFGASCQIPVTGIFHAIKDSISEDSVRVIVKMPIVEDDSPLYVCIKEGSGSNEQESVLDSSPFVHQGSESWLSVHSYEKGLPLWAGMIIIITCLCFSALFSGLNLGLMSLDRTELKILCNTGTEQEQRYAKKIQPVRNHGNFLLCSILLGNVLVNSTFTILLDDLTSGVIAVVCSTLAIVMFGEITPQAICSRHGLAIGAKTIFITKVVMAVTFPLSYPISRVLDVLLGEEIGSVYTRERLKELVKVTTGENDLDKDEVNIISGALELRRKTVADVMTKIEDAFMLSYDAILDFETVSEIMKSGYSRIPVYESDRETGRKNIVTTLYIKDLAFVDPDDNTPLKTLCQFYQNPCNFVFEDVTLDIMFKDFKEGNKGHMAFINTVNTEGEGDPFYETIGLITLEDVIEELIQAEIMDETDVFTDNRTKRKRNADRTKQDFTVFAERRGDSNRIRISPQLTLATYQYLSTSIEMFKPPTISETILRRLLKQDIYHHIKKNKDWRNDASTVIYQQRVQVDYFVLILEGRVEVKVGDENLTYESGPFTYFGTQALRTAPVESPATIGSLQSLHMDSMARCFFMPDYTVRACTEVLYLKLKRNLYLAAKRASLMEMSQRDSVTNGDPFDDEMEKFIDNSDVPSSHDPDAETNQLLHSLEDDGSIGRRSPDLPTTHQHLQVRHEKEEPESSDKTTSTSTTITPAMKATTPTTPSAAARRSVNGGLKNPTTPTNPANSSNPPTTSNEEGVASDKEEEQSLLSKKS